VARSAVLLACVALALGGATARADAPVALLAGVVHLTFDGSLSGSTTWVSTGQQAYSVPKVSWHLQWSTQVGRDVALPGASVFPFDDTKDDLDAYTLSGSASENTPAGDPFCSGSLQAGDVQQLAIVTHPQLQLLKNPDVPGTYLHRGTFTMGPPAFAVRFTSGNPFCTGGGFALLQGNRVPAVSFPLDLDAVVANGGKQSFKVGATYSAGGNESGSYTWSGTITITVDHGTYVALGDSFSSGDGAPPTAGACHRSAVAYPILFTKRLGLDRRELELAACSGATTASLAATQLSRIAPETQLVTLTIGGNDLDLFGIARECDRAPLFGSKTSCEQAHAAALRPLFAQLPGRLAAVYKAIRARGTNLRLWVVGYPNPFPATRPRSCPAATFVNGIFKGHGLAESDLPWFHGVVQRLDDAVRQVTEQPFFRTYVTYVDPSGAFAGRDVCAGAKSLIHPLSYALNESFHPNAAGNAAIADLLYRQFLKTPF
jgi:lysophospholipase L1-like esterase